MPRRDRIAEAAALLGIETAGHPRGTGMVVCNHTQSGTIGDFLPAFPGCAEIYVHLSHLWTKII